MRRGWASGLQGRAAVLDGRSLRGAYQRWTFLAGIRGGKTPTQTRRAVGWSGPAYWQARHRHPEWAAEIDRLYSTHLTRSHITFLTQP
jgi:hypothetical protein